MGEGRVGDGGGAGGTAGMSACALLCIAAVRMVMFCLGVWRDFFVLLCCVPGTSVFVWSRRKYLNQDVNS